MANYNGRRGPNVSQYLRELNAMPSDTPVEERFPLDDELALFTNTQFFDFESGQTTDFQPPPGKSESDTQSTRPEEPSSATSVIGDFPGMDFISGEHWIFWSLKKCSILLLFLCLFLWQTAFSGFLL